jgi:hypothetical protein
MWNDRQIAVEETNYKANNIYSSKTETHSEILGRYRNKQISSKVMFN